MRIRPISNERKSGLRWADVEQELLSRRKRFAHIQVAQDEAISCRLGERNRGHRITRMQVQDAITKALAIFHSRDSMCFHFTFRDRFQADQFQPRIGRLAEALRSELDYHPLVFLGGEFKEQLLVTRTKPPSSLMGQLNVLRLGWRASLLISGQASPGGGGLRRGIANNGPHDLRID